MNRRILVAVAVTVLAYVALERLGSWFTPQPELTADPDEHMRLLAFISAGIVFFAVSVGSWVARGSFLRPALALWCVSVIASMAVGYKLQRVAVPREFGEFAWVNAPMLGATLGATLLGVVFGGFLVRAQARQSTPAG
ncbi:hypothetical protein [Lysobacter olei]